MDDNKSPDQRRNDLLERLRKRFHQYQKRQNDYIGRFVSNEPMKEERERQENQMYHQKIANLRANSKPPRTKQDTTGKNSMNDTAFGSANMGQPYILQHLKRRFDQTFNQAVHDPDDLDETLGNKSARTDDHRNDLVTQFQPSNVMNNVNVTKQTDPTKLEDSLSNQKNAKVEQGSAISQHGHEQGSHILQVAGDSIDGTIGMDETAEEQPHNNNPIVSSAAHSNPKGSTDTSNSNSKMSTGNHDSASAALRPTKDSTINGLVDDGLPLDIIKDWDAFEDVFRHISEENSTSSTTNTNNDVPNRPENNSKPREQHTKPSPRERREHVKSSSSSGSLGSPSASQVPTFQNNTAALQNTVSARVAASSSAYQNNFPGTAPMRSQLQVPPPMIPGQANLRSYLAHHLQQNKQLGNHYAGNMNMPGRDMTPASTKAHLAQLQEHVRRRQMQQQQQMQRRQHMEMVRQQISQQMQQPYQQELMRMAQAAQHQQRLTAPQTMSPMSPHMQQSFSQQPLPSPMSSPMSHSPQLSSNQNPFQFPNDFNSYMNHKQLQGFENMGSMQAPPESNSQMQANFYSLSQQEHSPFSPGKPITPNSPHPSTPPFSRAMLVRERMLASNMMPPPQPMQNSIGPQGTFDGPGARPPPQYAPSNFQPVSTPLDGQQIQKTLSIGPRNTNRLSHFNASHPDELSMKSSGGLPMYAGGDSMFSSLSGPNPSVSTIPTGQLPDNLSTNANNYPPPNMSANNIVNIGRTSNISPSSHGNWDELQMSKQQVLQQRLNSMQPDYGPVPKGPSLSAHVARQNISHERPLSAAYSSQGQSIANMTQMSNSSIQSQTSYRMPKQALGVPKTVMSMQDSLGMPQRSNDSEDIESLLSNPPENFDLVQMLGP